MPHVKPTQEELAEIERNAIAEAEKLQDAPREEEETVDPSKQPEETEEVVEEVAEVEEQAEPSEEEKEALRKKLSASARENQRIYAKNRVINNAIVEAESMPEPTEDELRSSFADWDIMSEFEKTSAKEMTITKRWRSKIAEAGTQASKIEKWHESVSNFVEDPKTLIDNPGLEGNVDKFKAFATSDDNNNVPMRILVSAFLHENSTGKVNNKGKMFDTGTGGPSTKPVNKDAKIPVEEARKMRETDYGKWKEMLLNGKIQSEF